MPCSVTGAAEGCDLDHSLCGGEHSAEWAWAQAKRDELEAMLMEKEGELELLRAKVQSGEAEGGAEAENTPEQRRKLEEANVRQCQATAAAHVQGLRDFVDKHGLQSVNPTGALRSGLWLLLGRPAVREGRVRRRGSGPGHHPAAGRDGGPRLQHLPDRHAR